MLTQLLKALASMFSDDPSSPSITTSWLVERSVLYGSVIRYHERFGEDREVLFKCTAEDEAGLYVKLAEALGVNLAPTCGGPVNGSERK